MRLLIIIVNYRTADLTIDSLKSLSPEIGDVPDVRVAVIDNASGDGSVDKLRAAAAANDWRWLDVIPLQANGGFAVGNNVGIRTALTANSRYVLLLNPDTVVRRGALSALLEFMDRNPAVGIAGSRLENPDGTSQQAARRFPTVLSELESAVQLGLVTRVLSRCVVTPAERAEPHPCDWLPGASLMIRRGVFEDIGMLDEGYFMYFEEVDFCLRAKRAGWTVWYVPHSRVVHLVGQASGVTSRNGAGPIARKRRPGYWFESRKRYFTKNHGIVYRLMADLAWVTGHILHRIRGVLQNRARVDPPLLLSDFLRHSLLLSGGRE